MIGPAPRPPERPPRAPPPPPNDINPVVILKEAGGGRPIPLPALPEFGWTRAWRYIQVTLLTAHIGFLLLVGFAPAGWGWLQVWCLQMHLLTVWLTHPIRWWKGEWIQARMKAADRLLWSADARYAASLGIQAPPELPEPRPPPVTRQVSTHKDPR